MTNPQLALRRRGCERHIPAKPLLDEDGKRGSGQADDETREPKHVDALRCEGWLEGRRGSKHCCCSIGCLVRDDSENLQAFGRGILLKLRE